MSRFDPSSKPNIERMKANRDLEGLKKALAYQKDRNVRKEAVMALGNMGDTAATEGIAERLKDGDTEVRKAAAWALGRLRDARAVQPLINALRDANEGVRAAASKALGSIGDIAAIEPLTLVALIDKKRAVRRTAEEAIARLEDIKGTPKEEIEKTISEAEAIVAKPIEGSHDDVQQKTVSSADKYYLKLFENENCSRCKTFYTSPNKCPFDRDLRESCLLFEQIDEHERQAFLEDSFWRLMILEAMRGKRSRASVTCRYCGAQNGDPDITGRRTCNRCGRSLL